VKAFHTRRSSSGSACDGDRLVAASAERPRVHSRLHRPGFGAVMPIWWWLAVERLRSFPESGRVVPELNRPEIREVIVRPYRVVYRIRPGAVEIATVFRASRLLPGLM
jgi:ParE-like toxin of type II ParDE toxin-antitoxin system